MTPLRLEAPAKLNLSLAVTGRRADGFHELDSELVLLELADRLLLLPGCSGLGVEGGGARRCLSSAENLAWRGLLAGIGGEPDLVCLTLDKRVAVGAGLGGGSSDAAAAWRLGRRSQGAPEQADAATLELLSHIGADVPFFAAQPWQPRRWPVSGSESRRCRASRTRPTWCLQSTRPSPLSTAAVFAELRSTEWSGTAERGRNDLLAPALRPCNRPSRT